MNLLLVISTGKKGRFLKVNMTEFRGFGSSSQSTYTCYKNINRISTSCQSIDRQYMQLPPPFIHCGRGCQSAGLKKSSKKGLGVPANCRSMQFPYRNSLMTFASIQVLDFWIEPIIMLRPLFLFWAS